MKEKLINNLGLKILSCFLAFFVWLVVVNVSNPEVTGSKEVPLEIVNEQVLTKAGRTYELGGKDTVTVYFDVRTKDAYKIRSSDFRAYVDLAELYDVTGSVQVKIEVLNNKELISNAESRPGVVRIQTEELQSKQFSLIMNTYGNLAEDYAVNKAVLTPDHVTVEGPTSQVGLINHVGIELNVNGLESSTEGTAEPVFYDANGNEITVSDRVSVSPSEIQYNLEISKVKTLPLDFEVTGTAASGLSVYRRGVQYQECFRAWLKKQPGICEQDHHSVLCAQCFGSNTGQGGDSEFKRLSAGGCNTGQCGRRKRDHTP